MSSLAFVVRPQTKAHVKRRLSSISTKVEMASVDSMASRTFPEHCLIAK